MKVTIKDIAREADVSVGAVSLVLNHKPCRVSQAKRDIIFETAKKYNYQVNQAARSLVTKKTNILGLIIPDIENLFFSSLCKHMEEYCMDNNYMLMIVNTNDHEEDDLRLLDMLVSRGVDGIFIVPSNEALINNNRLPKALQELNIPYVQVDRHFEDINSNSVYFDNNEGANMAIKYLIQHGHTRIGCIGSRPYSSKNVSTRIAGYKRAMQEAHLEIKESDIFQGNYRYQDGYDAGLKIIKSDLSSVFICNDMMTLGFLHCLQDHGKSFPDDYSIISYDNTINPYMIGKKITVIAQDVNILANASCDVMFHHLLNKEALFKTIKLTPKLVEEDSVISHNI